MDSTELKNRTKVFAHRCVKLAASLPPTKLGSYIEGQLIRSSISIAANYRAACNSQSKRSFIAKLSIALEEADESQFWIKFIEDEKLIDSDKLKSILQESTELTNIFAASRLTARKSVKTNLPNKQNPNNTI